LIATSPKFKEPVSGTFPAKPERFSIIVWAISMELIDVI
jgi:hypothetical protein